MMNQTLPYIELDQQTSLSTYKTLKTLFQRIGTLEHHEQVHIYQQCIRHLIAKKDFSNGQRHD